MRAIHLYSIQAGNFLHRNHTKQDNTHPCTEAHFHAMINNYLHTRTAQLWVHAHMPLSQERKFNFSYCLSIATLYNMFCGSLKKKEI